MHWYIVLICYLRVCVVVRLVCFDFVEYEITSISIIILMAVASCMITVTI